MAIMAAKGDFPHVDCAIFADTGYEPKAVYTYLNFLKQYYLIQYLSSERKYKR